MTDYKTIAESNNFMVSVTNQLKLKAPDEKSRLTDVLDTIHQG